MPAMLPSQRLSLHAEQRSACPCYFDVAWTLTHANEYSKINAMYGPCNYKAVNWETSEEPYTTEQYEEFAAAFDAATKAEFSTTPQNKS